MEDTTFSFTGSKLKNRTVHKDYMYSISRHKIRYRAISLNCNFPSLLSSNISIYTRNIAEMIFNKMLHKDAQELLNIR